MPNHHCNLDYRPLVGAGIIWSLDSEVVYRISVVMSPLDEMYWYEIRRSIKSTCWCYKGSFMVRRKGQDNEHFKNSANKRTTCRPFISSACLNEPYTHLETVISLLCQDHSFDKFLDRVLNGATYSMQWCKLHNAPSESCCALLPFFTVTKYFALL